MFLPRGPVSSRPHVDDAVWTDKGQRREGLAAKTTGVGPAWRSRLVALPVSAAGSRGVASDPPGGVPVLMHCTTVESAATSQSSSPAAAAST